ncbi:hypothetical protein ACOPJQ_02445 [Luteimonas dalianensis]|uniref:hypothetical protein n=1 Tax=Luteimonas dalianensis TaxID=1148196 RepID=UPI003BF20CCE
MTSQKPGTAWIRAARAHSGRAQPKAASLLDAAAGSELPPDPDLEAAQRQLDCVLTEFRESEDRGAEAFGRYCGSLARIIRCSGLSERRAARLLGRYVRTAADARRTAGRPPAFGVVLLDFLRHEINRERGITSWEESIRARIPASEIAVRAARDWGVSLTPEQVRKRLARQAANNRN